MLLVKPARRDSLAENNRLPRLTGGSLGLADHHPERSADPRVVRFSAKVAGMALHRGNQDRAFSELPTTHSELSLNGTPLGGPIRLQFTFLSE